MRLPCGLASTMSSSGTDNKEHAHSHALYHEANTSALLFCDFTTEQSAKDIPPSSYGNTTAAARLLHQPARAFNFPELHRCLQCWISLKGKQMFLNQPPTFGNRVYATGCEYINKLTVNGANRQHQRHFVFHLLSVQCCSFAKQYILHLLWSQQSSETNDRGFNPPAGGKQALQGTVFWPHQPRTACRLCERKR